jgi:hypothetical protein
MNIDAKLPNKIFVNRIQQNIKKMIYYTQVDFIAEAQVWVTKHK